MGSLNSSLTERETTAEYYLMLQKAREYDDPILPIIDHAKHSYNYQRMELPVDNEGYVKSFDFDDKEGILSFFNEYGVVVVHDCLSVEECKNSVDEVWEHLDRHYGVKRDNPNTWENEKWPGLYKLGILGSIPVLSKQLTANRQNKKIRKVFQTLFKSKNLITGIGRIGMMRPTRSVQMSPNMPPVDRPDWETINVWPHLDMCPWTWKVTDHGFLRGKHVVDYDILKLQGMVALHNNRVNDGGLRVLPGFHKHIRGWANENIKLLECKEFKTTSVQIPTSDPIINDLQKVPLRAGSLCIWRTEIIHDTSPCTSESGRLIQYIRMAPTTDKTVKQWNP
eukprot:gene6110-8424_t